MLVDNYILGYKAIMDEVSIHTPRMSPTLEKAIEAKFKNKTDLYDLVADRIDAHITELERVIDESDRAEERTSPATVTTTFYQASSPHKQDPSVHQTPIAPG